MEIRFGECAIDRARRRVVRRGRPVHVTPKAFELLEILLDARARVVPKTELFERLWPRTHVVEGNLSNLIAEIRMAIGDSFPESRWLKTIYSFGYGLNVPLPAAVSGAAIDEEGPFLWLVYEGGHVPLSEGDHLIGRHPRSAVYISCSAVSRQHASIAVSEGQAVLRDLGSRNGTYIGRCAIQEPTVLSDGDRIQLGTVVLEFRVMDLRVPTEVLMLRRRVPRRP